MLDRDPKKRLGSGPDDADEVVAHPWFAGFDWMALMEKKLVAEYIPECNIDQELASLEAQALATPSKSIKQEDEEDHFTPTQKDLINSQQHQFMNF